MNPWPMLIADLRAMRWTALLVMLLIAVAVAIGVSIGAQERALRQASARAADDLPLLIGAPGSQTQLVMTAAYLQIEAIPLIDGGLLNTLAADPRVAGVAPIAFGDIVRGWPVIGTTAPLVTAWGRLSPSEGRVFRAESEAVIGADVALPIGAEITPSHGVKAHGPVGTETKDEHARKHEGTVYTVVGRLPRRGTPWDRAILVPIETVWETHGLGNGHQIEDGPLGPPFDAKAVPGVPAIVVKPRGVADAYMLRSAFRQGGTMALFPAEVLVSIYRSIGDLRDVLLVVTALNNLVVLLAVLLVAVTLVGLRRRGYAMLRALRAPRSYVFLVIWLGVAILIAGGCVGGLALGWIAATLAAEWIAQVTGLHAVATPGWSKLRLVLILLLVGSALAVVPAWLAGRTPVSTALRES
ncbi:MAG: ABC transporter permease [Acetobacteraceae bacterium]|nr:ABC transporter permease [Acetobacteraceae bacterium]